MEEGWILNQKQILKPKKTVPQLHGFHKDFVSFYITFYYCLNAALLHLAKPEPDKLEKVDKFSDYNPRAL